MRFKLLFTKKAERALDNLPETFRVKIVHVFREMESNPFFGKKLSGTKKGQYSVRIWPYRIIYSIEKKQLIIIAIDIGHRQGIYKNS